jgi:glycosyltransferase involved in cell wall biosynthesis
VIYFLTPDENRPSGGTRQIYLMVDLLRELGYDAAVFHGEPGFRCTWFENDTPVVSKPFLTLDRGDIFVIPEYGGARERPRCAEARVVILNQNHFRTFINVPGDDTSGGYPGWPHAAAVLYTSDAIRRFLSLAMRESVPTYRTRVVVSSLFAPRDKRKLVVLMRRKRHAQGEAVVQLARRHSSGWEFDAIDGLEQSAVARRLGEAAMFLSFSEEEGFGLPPAEAMAAGCYVVGYTGDGGREFMNEQWCSPISDQDVVGFATEVIRVAKWWESDPDGVQRVADLGREFVTSTYARDELRSDLDAAFSELTNLGSQAVQPHAVEVTHWSVPVGPRGRLVRTWRSSARRWGRQ